MNSIFAAGTNPRSRESRGRLNSAEMSNSAEIDFGEVVGRIWQRTGEFGRTAWGRGKGGEGKASGSGGEDSDGQTAERARLGRRRGKVKMRVRLGVDWLARAKASRQFFRGRAEELVGRRVAGMGNQRSTGCGRDGRSRRRVEADGDAEREIEASREGKFEERGLRAPTEILAEIPESGGCDGMRVAGR